MLLFFVLLIPLAGLKERLCREIMQIRPFQTMYNVVIAKNVNLDAWHGAKLIANSNNFADCLTTRNDYLEYGGEYFKEHYASNKFFATPIVLNETSQTSNEPDGTNKTVPVHFDASLMKIDDEMYVE